jgi:hypothetical protein
MKLGKILGVVRKILGKLTDILIQGRQAGLWTENPTIPGKKKEIK